jgi:chorismate mutase
MAERLKDIRDEIDVVDEKIIKLLERRVGLAKEAYVIKKINNRPVADPIREKEVLDHAVKTTSLDKNFIKSLFKSIIEFCKNEEQK